MSLGEHPKFHGPRGYAEFSAECGKISLKTHTYTRTHRERIAAAHCTPTQNTYLHAYVTLIQLHFGCSFPLIEHVCTLL